ncbi:hypothetical protein AB4Z52_20260 [Rhizobium sp. 2YAF20]|uniref:hypothetical protein n=1 Tax=Rhizobium sp. 2YAF20 TaxID=3233027 RepID=UPI003F9BA524
MIVSNTPVIVDVIAGTTISGNGLAVANTGTGGVFIINNGAIAVDVGNTPTAGGTAALSVSAAGAITYTGGNITNNGAGNAFDATQTGGVGSVNINITGNVSAATGEGIVVRDVATSTGISVTTNDVTALTAGKDGINIQSNLLAGNITEVANGNIRAGNAGMVAAFLGAGAAGNIDATANGSIDARFGIDAENFGSGSTTVTTVGPVTATSGDGIFALSSGGAVTVNAGDVTPPATRRSSHDRPELEPARSPSPPAARSKAPSPRSTHNQSPTTLSASLLIETFDLSVALRGRNAMPAERLKMWRVREILRYRFEDGLGHGSIALHVGAAPSTVRETLRRVEIAGLSWP